MTVASGDVSSDSETDLPRVNVTGRFSRSGRPSVSSKGLQF